MVYSKDITIYKLTINYSTCRKFFQQMYIIEGT